ncbi:MAG: hypothetical protein COB35_10200 [Gammaproteobacteria bacterium]|nr:MAG: hypothetical protein COB35_10200 [Gammaproteobacteria bacterium]
MLVTWYKRQEKNKLHKKELNCSFYVQDERYVAEPWMARSDDVQDERYVAEPWMARSDDV